MRIQKFEDLISWQKRKLLFVELHTWFSSEKDYFKDQLFRAALSISNNIAEGFDRKSDRELAQFFIIARGSCAEVRSMIYIAEAVNKLNQEQKLYFIELTDEISRLLTGFVQKLAISDKRLGTG